MLRLNHALADGLGAIQLFELIHSRQREPTPSKLVPLGSVMVAVTVQVLAILYLFYRSNMFMKKWVPDTVLVTFWLSPVQNISA